MEQELGVEGGQGGEDPRQDQYHRRRGDARRPLPAMGGLGGAFGRPAGEASLPGDFLGQLLRVAQLLDQRGLSLRPRLFKILLVIAHNLQALPVRDQGGQGRAEMPQIVLLAHPCSPPSKSK